MMGNNVIITGITGFVGQNLNMYLNDKGVTTFSLSLRDKTWKNQLQEGSYALIHLAGKAHDLKNRCEEDEYFQVNFELTKEIYQKFLKSQVKVFIFMSSVKAAADTLDEILRETDVETPITPYGKSKRKAEEYILQNIPKNKRVYILRPCMIHGLGNKGNLNLLFSFAKKGIPYPLASFHNRRSFLSVENLCFVINELLNNENIPSGIYNVADDEPLSTNEVMIMAGESLHVKIHMWKVPCLLIKLIARIGDYVKFPLNSDKLKKLTESYVVDNSKIISAIRKPLPISSRGGIINTFKTFNNT